MEAPLAELADITRTDIRRGYRNAGIGFAIGIALGAALIAGASVVMRGGLVFAPVAVPFGVAFGLFGASFGMMIGSAPIVRRMREATGTDRSTRRRIRRVVLGGRPDQLSDEEQRRATRWAAIVAPWFPYSAVEGR
jgi:hypothetical protein